MYTTSKQIFKREKFNLQIIGCIPIDRYDQSKSNVYNIGSGNVFE